MISLSRVLSRKTDILIESIFGKGIGHITLRVPFNLVLSFFHYVTQFNVMKISSRIGVVINNFKAI